MQDAKGHLAVLDAFIVNQASALNRITHMRNEFAHEQGLHLSDVVVRVEGAKPGPIEVDDLPSFCSPVADCSAVADCSPVNGAGAVPSEQVQFVNKRHRIRSESAAITVHRRKLAIRMLEVGPMRFTDVLLFLGVGSGSAGWILNHQWFCRVEDGKRYVTDSCRAALKEQGVKT